MKGIYIKKLVGGAQKNKAKQTQFVRKELCEGLQEEHKYEHLFLIYAEALRRCPQLLSTA